MTQDEPTMLEEQPGAADSEPHQRSFLVPLLLLLVVALVATSGFLGWRLYDAHDDLGQARATSQAREDAQQAAREFAVLVATYSPETLDDDVDKVLERTTGQFRTEYESASSSLRESIVELEGRSTGEVQDVGVVTATNDRAEVVVFLDQVVRNAELRRPRTDRTRLHLVLVREAGEWRVSELKLV